MSELMKENYDFFVLVGLVLFLFVALKVIGIVQEKNYLKYINRRARVYRNEKPDIKRDYNLVMEAENLKNFDFKVDMTTFYDLNLLSYLKCIDFSMSTLGSSMLYIKTRLGRKIFKEQSVIKKLRDEEEKSIKVMSYFLGFGEIKNKDFFELLKSGINGKSNFSLYVKIYPLLIIFFAFLFFLDKRIFLLIFIALLFMNGLIARDISKKTDGISKMLSMVAKFARLGISVMESGLERESVENLRKYEKLLKKLNKKTGSFYNKVGLDTDAIYGIINIITLHEARLYTGVTNLLNENLEELRELYFDLGTVDMEIAVANFYESLDTKCEVEISDHIEAENLHNPIIYLKNFEESVPNSFNFRVNVLLTGSNASGKSTFLRTIGLSHIMGRTLGFVIAESFSTIDADILTSIDIKDSIEDKTSYFMQEAKTIKKMIENPGGLYLLDEVFKGTNTIDRISAASSTLKYLAKIGKVFAATHDIELTEILKSEFKNYHFEEIVSRDDIEFDYVLKEGPAKTRNAIKILEMYNYPTTITNSARNMAENLSG